MGGDRGERHGDSHGSPYFRHIDGLRAIAVLAVIAYHLEPSWLPGGFAGVDVFFVISGFVVSASVARFRTDRFGAFALPFYARRLRRIVPALLACLLVTGVFSALLIPPAWLSEANHRTGWWAFFGLSNVLLAATADDYFAPRVEFNPYTHTWSLGVEEQFYLVFPLLFLPWLRGGSARRIAFGLLGFVAIASAMHAASGDAPATFYGIASRFWQLAAGVLLYQAIGASGAEGEATGKVRWFLSAALALALAMLVLGLVTARAGNSPWPDGVLPVIGTLGLLAGLHRRGSRGWVHAALTLAPVAWIGRISYSLYLWHWPVFVLMRWTLGLETASQRAFATLLAFALAVASYKLVEQPMRNSPRLARWPRARLLAGGAVVLVAGAVTFSLIQRYQPALSLSVVARERADWSPEGELPPTAATCRIERRIERPAADPVWVFERRGCPPPGEPVPHVFVVGDSHATGYAQMLRLHALATGATVRVYQTAGCPFIGLVESGEFSEPACAAAATAALADVRRLARRGDVLFLPSLRLHRLSDQWARTEPAIVDPAGRELDAETARRQAEVAAIAQLAPLAAAGLRVVFEAPKPVFPAPAYRCSDGFNRDNPVCAGGLEIPRAQIDAWRAPILASYARIATSVPGTTVWDPLPSLCPQSTCRAVENGRPLFFDGDHLSGFGNRLLAPGFSAHVASR